MFYFAPNCSKRYYFLFAYDLITVFCNAVSFLLIYLYIKYNLHLYFDYKVSLYVKTIATLACTWIKNLFAGPINNFKETGMPGLLFIFFTATASTEHRLISFSMFSQNGYTQNLSMNLFIRSVSFGPQPDCI